MSIGRIFGWMIVTGYLLTVLNYVVKFVNRKWIMSMPKEAKGRIRYQAFMRFIVKNHRYFAIFTTLALITHFIIQYLSWGFYTSGLIAGGLMIIQGSLGGYGTYVKHKKSGPWLVVHRTIAVLLMLGILTHVLIAKLT